MKRLLLSVLIAVLLAGCGGSNDNKAKLGSSGETTTTTGPASPGLTVPTPQGPRVPGNDASSATTTTTAAPSDSKTPTTRPKPTATLDPKCVRKGPAGDTLTLTVRTNPDGTVGYTSKYSDGSTKFTKPAYESGDGYGRADSTGVYVVSWKVPASAPDGPATLTWAAQGDFQTPFTFTIVSATGKC